MFENCSNLNGAIPEKLFRSNISVETFANTFKGCIGLEGTIPENLFVNNGEVQDFSNVFNGCTKLAGMVPAKLFKYNSKATNYAGTFKGCANITAAELQINTSNVENMDEIFAGCTALESIVLGEEFKNLTGTNMFQNCSLLRAIIMLNNPETTADVGTIANVETLGLATGTIIYVPYEEDELLYEEVVTNVSGERIKQVIKANEPNPDYVELNGMYEDTGYTVAGFGSGEEGKWKQYGFYVVEDGIPVETDEVGSEWIKYKLKR